MANIDFPSSPTTGQQYTYGGVTYTFSAQGVWNPVASISSKNSSPPQGRITLQSQTPVMVAQATGSTSLLYTPYQGDKIPLFDGTGLVMNRFDEITGTTVDNTHNPSVIGANKNNDWFVWKDISVPATPVLRLSHGPDWTDDVTRSAGTALVRINGIFLNAVPLGNGTTTGPAAQRGTYVGTTRSNASSLLDWKLGSSALGGGTATLNVWNCYNRKDTFTQVSDSTSSWNPPGVIRALNGSNNNRANFVTGLAEDAIQASFWQPSNFGAGQNLIVGVGLDQLAHFDGPTGYISSANGGGHTLGAVNIFPAVLGYHFIQFLEWTTTSTTEYGNQTVLAGPLFLLSQGLQLTLMM